MCLLYSSQRRKEKNRSSTCTKKKGTPVPSRYIVRRTANFFMYALPANGETVYKGNALERGVIKNDNEKVIIIIKRKRNKLSNPPLCNKVFWEKRKERWGRHVTTLLKKKRNRLSILLFVRNNDIMKAKTPKRRWGLKIDDTSFHLRLRKCFFPHTHGWGINNWVITGMNFLCFIYLFFYLGNKLQERLNLPFDAYVIRLFAGLRLKVIK